LEVVVCCSRNYPETAALDGFEALAMFFSQARLPNRAGIFYDGSNNSFVVEQQLSITNLWICGETR
jgi:hypothetical protein